MWVDLRARAGLVVSYLEAGLLLLESLCPTSCTPHTCGFESARVDRSTLIRGLLFVCVRCSCKLCGKKISQNSCVYGTSASQRVSPVDLRTSCHPVTITNTQLPSSHNQQHPKSSRPAPLVSLLQVTTSVVGTYHRHPPHLKRQPPQPPQTPAPINRQPPALVCPCLLQVNHVRSRGGAVLKSRLIFKIIGAALCARWLDP